MSDVRLVTIRLGTKLGASYVFPDVERRALEQLCPFMQDGVPEGHAGQLSLINSSIAIMSVPFRIIKTVETSDDGLGWTMWWTAPEREDECYPASTVSKE